MYTQYYLFTDFLQQYASISTIEFNTSLFKINPEDISNILSSPKNHHLKKFECKLYIYINGLARTRPIRPSY